MFEGKYARIRVMDSTDAEYVRLLRNSPEVSQFHQFQFFLSDIEQTRFVESLAGDRSRVFFVAEKLDTNERFGVYCLQSIDFRNQRADSGIFLDSDRAGHAIHAFEAAFMLYEYAFNYLNLRKITGQVLAFNTPAIRWNETVGYRQEGILRQHMYCQGRFQDLILFALFRDNFYNQPTESMKMFLLERKN